MDIKLKKTHPDAIIPQYATADAACVDLHALIDNDAAYAIDYGEPSVFRTGISVEVPTGHVMLVFSRSGHGFKSDTRLSNSVGIIDADYRGEIRVKLTRDKSDTDEIEVRHGDRIAQAIVLPYEQINFVEVTELSDTARGTGGYGSTGK